MEEEHVPTHIGIILDGNRRFAKKLMLKPWMGHEWGAKKFHDVMEWAAELKVNELTLYTLSLQNLSRPKEELNYLFDLFRKEMRDIIENKQDELKEKGLRIRFVGRRHLLPADLQELMATVEKATAANTPRQLNLAMAYGGREEVIDAVQRMAREGIDLKNVNDETFTKHLLVQSEPELVIRTGGEQRTSNFLIWQSNYSEWIFIDKPWPEFSKQDFVAAIAEYQNRERRFGK